MPDEDVRDPDADPPQLRQLARDLVGHEVEAARTWVEAYLALEPDGHADSRAQTVAPTHAPGQPRAGASARRAAARTGSAVRPRSRSSPRRSRPRCHGSRD